MTKKTKESDLKKAQRFEKISLMFKEDMENEYAKYLNKCIKECKDDILDIISWSELQIATYKKE